MGWRADRGYEEAQRKDFLAWRASLTWREYWAWWWNRWRHVLTGAAMAAVWGGVFWWMLT